MANSPRTGLLWFGALLALIGIIAIAVPVFTTEHTEDVAKVGDLRLTAKEHTHHFVPPFLGPALLAAGVVLVGVGAVSRR